jgi:hypothetical protein
MKQLFYILNTLVFIVGIQGKYEDIYCNTCPSYVQFIKNTNCERVNYKCTCNCLSGCFLNNNMLVSNGYSLMENSVISIDIIHYQIDTCSKCFSLWNAWECKIQNQNYKLSNSIINACEHSIDYEKYMDNCNLNVSLISPQSYEHFDTNILMHSRKLTTFLESMFNGTTTDAFVIASWFISVGGIFVVLLLISLLCCCCKLFIIK